jgi:hypothetical protein
MISPSERGHSSSAPGDQTDGFSRKYSCASDAGQQAQMNSFLQVFHPSQVSDKLVTGCSPLFTANQVQYAEVARDHDSSIQDIHIQDLQGESV